MYMRKAADQIHRNKQELLPYETLRLPLHGSYDKEILAQKLKIMYTGRS